jgi:hypothetical protein
MRSWVSVTVAIAPIYGSSGVYAPVIATVISMQMRYVMAHRINLVRKENDLTFMWNIDNTVGYSYDCVNNVDDVALVQLLLYQIFCPVMGVARDIKEVPKINGVMDAATGFWIFAAQIELQHLSNGQYRKGHADGFLSPANTVFNSRKLICRLNMQLSSRTKSNGLTVQADLPNEPMCLPWLKIKLLATSR